MERLYSRIRVIFRLPDAILFAQTQLGNHLAISVQVLIAHILKQRRTCANHFQKASARGMILGMKLKVVSQLVDAPGQNSDLDLWRTCVFFGGLVIRDDLLLFVLGYHIFTNTFHLLRDAHAAHIVIFSFNKRHIITKKKDFAMVFLQIQKWV